MALDPGAAMTAVPSALAIAADYWDPPEDSGAAQDRELALECSRDLRVFIREAWPLLEPARPFVAAWHIDCVAEHLMAVSAGEIQRLIVNQPPGSTKSSLAAVMWPSWEWLTRPHLRWIYASYGQDFAFRDSRKMRTVVESRGGKDTGCLFERRGYQGVLALLGQGWSLAADQNAKGRYETTTGGMRFATSVGGQVTGDHGDRLVIDDPLDPDQARSPTERDGVNRWWDEKFSSRFIDSDAAAVLVMQRLNEKDLTGHLLASAEEWHHLCLPAEYVPNHPSTYPATTPFVLPSGEPVSGDRRTEPGELLDPVRISEAVLARHRYKSFMFAGQYQQQPAPEGGGMFKAAWFERRWEPGFHRYLELGWDQVIQSWDMAFKGTAASDYVVGQVWGFHGADCYLLAMVRARLDFAATLHAVRALSAFEPFGTLAVAKLVEDAANGPAVISTLRREVAGLIALPAKGSKPARASAVSPRFEAGNVVLPAADTIPCPDGYTDEGGEWHALMPTTVSDFVHEFCVFDAGANDDMVDAASQALTWANPQPRPDESFTPSLPARTIMAGVLDMPS